MNLGPNTVASTYQYILNQSGKSITLGSGQSVDWNGAGVIAATGDQTISGTKTFAYGINAGINGSGFNNFTVDSDFVYIYGIGPLGLFRFLSSEEGVIADQYSNPIIDVFGRSIICTKKNISGDVTGLFPVINLDNQASLLDPQSQNPILKWGDGILQSSGVSCYLGDNAFNAFGNAGIENYFGDGGENNSFGPNAFNNRFGENSQNNQFGSLTGVNEFYGTLSILNTGKMRLANFTGASSQSGLRGELRVSGSGLYVCTGANSGWGRVFLSSF